MNQLELAKLIAESMGYNPDTGAPEWHTILPDDVRSHLWDMGWRSIRFTDTDRARRCPAQLRFHLDSARGGPLTRGYEKQAKPAMMYGGSVFHKAFELPVSSVSNTASFWRACMEQVDEEHHGERYVMPDGEPIGNEVKWLLAQRMVRNLPGTNMAQIVKDLRKEIDDTGWVIVDQEVRVNIKEGARGGGGSELLTFTGTLDLRLELGGDAAEWGHGGNPPRAILDTKSSGLWDPIIRPEVRKSVKAQSFTRDQIASHRQLIHYAWLSKMHDGWEPDFIGLALPTNLIPLQRNTRTKSKGDRRGLPIIMAHVKSVAGDHYIDAYQNDLIGMLTMWTRGGWPRLRPATFGTPDCPGCSFFKACMSDRARAMSVAGGDALTSMFKGM